MSSLLEQASIIITPNAYKAGKLYGLKGTDLDVVRATTATRVNAEGLIESVANNIPRLDYTNGSCPSILVEPQRTNLVLRSEEFENASYNVSLRNGSIAVDSLISPDGNLTADNYVENNTTNIRAIFQTTSLASGTIYTLSVFAKNNGRILQLSGTTTGFGSNAFANFDLNDGTIGTIGSSASAEIENYNNGWYRCSIRITATSTTAAGGGLIILSNSKTSGRLPSYLGDGVSGVYLWGAQLESGSNATSYIPTVASTVTRNADNIDLFNSGILPTAYPFTILTKAKYSSILQYFVLSFLDSSRNDAYFSIRFLSNKINALIRPNTTEILVTSTSNFNEGDLVNIVLKVTSSQIKLFVNGQIEATTTNTLLFNSSINDLTLGRLRIVNDTNTRIGNNSVVIWNQELTDQECINLTTL